MRLKILFLSLVVSFGILNAQDTIRTLIITEARVDAASSAYVEITNVGIVPLNLNDFEFGVVGPWTQPYSPAADYSVRIGSLFSDPTIEAGASIVFAMVYDHNPEQWLVNPDNFSKAITKEDMWELADVQFHFREDLTGTAATDSVSPWYHALEVWNGRDCWYIRHHISETDSAVVDQVNGIFDEEDGTSRDAAHDVAGVTNATNNSVLVRKFSVKSGNLDFESARGLDLEDSEWMPVPVQIGGWEPNRISFWTVGNHGDYNLDAATLTSSTIQINWVNEVLTVPWGVRNNDSLMLQFDKTPGLAWHYHLAPNSVDSSFISARTGDRITIYACGNDMDIIDFDIIVSEPTAGANIVMPKTTLNNRGYYGNNNDGLYDVTDKVPGMDTIRAIPFATRTDTLLKYLEKAPKASWEFVWVDGVERTDLKLGDILKVKAENGTEKSYYLKVDVYRPSHNAYLSSITWPDIPEFYKGIFGWVGDTIPNFVRSKFDYKVQVPAIVDGIPALLAKNEQLNASTVVDRAKSLKGNEADRTVTFTSTAEDDTTILTYKVKLEKQVDPDFVQPWLGEPFLSQLIFWEQWNNGIIEFVNPGTEPLDFSNYMIFFQWSNDPAEAVTWFSADSDGDFSGRYVKYIPGYKWTDDRTEWGINPGIAIQDLAVNAIIEPGDVFVAADLRESGTSGYPWWLSEQADIDFAHNPWGVTISGETCPRQWMGANLYLYKILNDSIREGTKPANDPNDFLLIETFGMGEGVNWVIGGVESNMIHGYVRKPHVYKGATGFKESFGTDAETSEWLMTNEAYYQARNAGWPNQILLVADGTGSHFMDDVTVGRSTITSRFYKLSLGYSKSETCEGVVAGTTVNQLLEKVNKQDPGQTITLKSGNSVITGGTVLAAGDSIIVKSADLSNTSAYVIQIGALSNNAVLTSTAYTVTVTGATGIVTGFQAGTKLATVVENVTVPAGASMDVVDASGAYVPMKILNFDTTYSDVTATQYIYLAVVAENGTTEIFYQLKPNVLATDAYLNSFVYEVDQEVSLIYNVPMGTTVQSFFENVFPAEGASMQVIDKLGIERSLGNVIKDDKIVVTAQDGVTTRQYYLSMLQEQVYMAYVLSDVYMVDQLVFHIEGAFYEDVTTVAQFMQNLIPARGATLKVENENGTPNTGVLKRQNRLVVTSENKVNSVSYDLAVRIVSVKDIAGSAVKMYPNPTTGSVTMDGLQKGSRLQVYNIAGICIRDIAVHQVTESFSLEGQAAGMYFVVITDNNTVTGRHKLILK